MHRLDVRIQRLLRQLLRRRAATRPWVQPQRQRQARVARLCRQHCRGRHAAWRRQRLPALLHAQTPCVGGQAQAAVLEEPLGGAGQVCVVGVQQQHGRVARHQGCQPAQLDLPRHDHHVLLFGCCCCCCCCCCWATITGSAGSAVGCCCGELLRPPLLILPSPNRPSSQECILVALVP